MKILIKNCNLISMSEKRKKYEKEIDILIDGKKIKKIEKNINEMNCDKVINAKNKIVMPGLVNSHTHIPMSIFKDTLEGYELQEWLHDKIWPIEEKLTSDDIYYASLLSCVEMIRSGTTCFNDQYFMPEEIIKATSKIGIRTHCTRPLIDTTGNLEERLDELEDLLVKYKNNDMITINIGVHSLYTCKEKCVEKAVKLAEKYNSYIHMHFAENFQELEDIKKVYNTDSPINLLNKYFSKQKLVLAHCVKIASEEIYKLKDMDLSIVHCPISNLKLGCGIAKISEFVNNGINVALGTDGQGSGNNLDMFDVMSYASLLQKGIYENAKLLPSYDVIKMATINGAKALNMQDKIGSIDENKYADMIILDLKSAKTEPINNVFSNIVYNVNSSNVNTTIINGNIVMQDRKINGINEEEIYSKTSKILTNHHFVV